MQGTLLSNAKRNEIKNVAFILNGMKWCVSISKQRYDINNIRVR